MSTPQWPVTSSYVTIFQPGQGQPANALSNMSSTVVIYASSIPPATTTTGTPVNPGAILPWPAGTPLYVVCAQGSTATVQLLDNPDLQFWDPQSLANQIVLASPGGQTLAQQIASAINLVGVPAIDQPALLYNSGNKTVASGGQINFVPNLDVSKYPSLYVLITDTGTGAYAGLDERLYTFNWLDPTATFFLNSRRYYCANASGVLQMNIRTRSPLLAISNINTIARSSTVQIVVFGSFRTVPQDTIFVQNAANSFANQLTFSALDELTNVMSFAGTTGAAGTWSQSQNFQVGDYAFEISTSAIATVTLTNFSTGAELYKWTTTAGGALVVPNVHLGPLNYATNLSTTGASVVYTIAQSRQGSE